MVAICGGQHLLLTQPLPLPHFRHGRLPLRSISFSKPIMHHSSISSLQPLLLPCRVSSSGGYNNNSNDGGGGGGGGKGDWWWGNPFESDDDDDEWKKKFLLLLLLLPGVLLYARTAIARSKEEGEGEGEDIWEVRGGKWTSLVPREKRKKNVSGEYSYWSQCRDVFYGLMLPEGFPNSVSDDYLQYSLWRGVQGIASQISGVLATQSLLYAVGLGKGAIPTAAAVNWVLKDGIGYLSKIFLSKFGRHFDVNPKGWRLFADLLENAAYGLEILTPAFPQYFVLIGAAAGAGRSASILIQSATRSCFFAGFAVQRNSAEVIAKGEAQGMVSKFLGIMLGIALANCVSSSTTLALASFCVVTGVHMYCNLKSYQSIQLRTLNPYRSSLVFSEYLLSGEVPSVREVNDEEPLFPTLQNINSDKRTESSPTLSAEAKDAAGDICRQLHLGYKLSAIVKNKDDAFSLFDLFRDEGYLLAELNGRFYVVLKEGCSPQDMLKSLFHVNYLYWLERNVGMESRCIADECKTGGRLQISLDYVQREFSHVKQDGLRSGWLTEDGLIARPLPSRLRLGYTDSAQTS